MKLKKPLGGRPRVYAYALSARVRFYGGVIPLRIVGRSLRDGLPEYCVKAQAANTFWVREAEISLFTQQPLLCRHEGYLEETYRPDGEAVIFCSLCGLDSFL